MDFIKKNHKKLPFPIVEFFEKIEIQDQEDAKSFFKNAIQKIIDFDKKQNSLRDFANRIKNDKFKILHSDEVKRHWINIKMKQAEECIRLEADKLELNRQQFLLSRANKRTAKLMEDEEEKKTEYKKEKEVKKIRNYLEGRSIEDEMVEERIKWIIAGQDVSKELLEFREQCKRKAESNHLKSDIDELALNGIFYISKSNKHYKIEEETYAKMIDQMKEKFHADVDWENVDDFQTKSLREIYKKANESSKLAKHMASDLMFENEGHNESMSEALFNIVNNQTSTPTIREDVFTKKYVTPLLSSFFKDTKQIKIFGCDEESMGSKQRRERYGRKSDGGLKVLYKELEQQVLHYEIKNSNLVNEDWHYHPDFTKLLNIMKDEVDLLLKENCPEEIPMFGMLIGGHKVKVYAMDLIFTHIYRVCDIGMFYLPHSNHDLSRLDQAFDVLIKTKELALGSCEKCLEFFKRKDIPATPPQRRQLYVKSFRSPKKFQ